MRNKIKDHPEGGKHKWEHVKNVTLQEQKFYANGSSSITVKYRGQYKCDCGAIKLGVSKS